MKLLILSDLHAEFETFEVAKDSDYDLIVLAGDIMATGCASPFGLATSIHVLHCGSIVIAGMRCP